jgi:hypothetical protein
MGVDAGDYDGSGRASIFVTNYENELHSLYKNDSTPGQEFFRFATRTSGLSTIGQTWVGWGTAFVDFNHDGWEDLLILNGHAIRNPKGKTPRLQPPVLFVNQGKGRFVEASANGGPFFEQRHNARGVAFGDLDNNGTIDAVILRQNAPVVLLESLVTKPQQHWLGVQLQGKNHRDLAGARVVLTAGGRKQTRFFKGGGSFASSSDRRLHFGLGSATTVERLEVYWPGGKEPVVVPVSEVDQYLTIPES